MGQFNPIKVNGRQANPEVVRQIDSAIDKLQQAKREYVETALPNTFVEARLRQSELTINSIKRDLHYA